MTSDRLIAFGKQCSPEYLFSDYAIEDKDRNEYKLSIAAVGILRGGAGPTPAYCNEVKNRLATFLLHEGMPFDEVHTFVNALMQVACSKMDCYS